MSYNFIKSSLDLSLSDGKADFAELEKYIAFKSNSFILKHNIDAINSFLKFLKSSDNIFILNGFMGSGKTYTSDSLLDFISEEVLIFKNSYQEAINPDDVLLSLFKDFSIYHHEKKIVLPKVESNVFSEKINSYIKNCNAPMLFVFDSFEINTRSKDTQKDILDFINFLSHFEKIKILICSRSFRKDDLISDIGVSSFSLKSISKEEMYDYLNLYSISGSKYEIEELYKTSRGHYVLLELSVLIMNLLQINLSAFSTEYKKSTRNFLDFLISKLFSISSEKFAKILVLLAIIRHGLTSEFLCENDIATEEEILYLVQKHIIAEKFGKYYLKDYMKNEYIKTISPETKIKVHEYLIKIYEDELPLKPFERKLFLSRQTMRQEIAFHKVKIDKIQVEQIKLNKAKLPEMKDFNYYSYSKNSGYENEKQPEKTYKRIISDKNNRMDLSRQDTVILPGSSDNYIENELKELADIQGIETQYKESSKKSLSKEDSIPNSLDEYFEIAQNYENAYNFSSAVLYYKKALSYKDDIDYSIKEPTIYLQLANCYKRLQDYEEAVNMYEKVYDIYIKTSVDMANEILLNIAKIYNEVYKFEKEKEIYNRILYSEKGCSPEMSVRVYLDLSELENNNLDMAVSLKYLQKALKEAEKLSNIGLLTECYFKYALFMDDNDNLDMAQKYYLRCIQCSNNPKENIYLSSAYVNLAEISSDNNNYSAAKMYYELAVNADKVSNNNEGLYYSYSKLADLYAKDSQSKRYEYLVKALSCAKKFDDISYAVSVYVEIGDYYYDIADYKKALKAYYLAKTLMPSHISENIQNKISSGINKVRVSLGDNEYIKILNEIKKKK